MWKGNINYLVKLNVASVLAFMGCIPQKKIKASGRNYATACLIICRVSNYKHLRWALNRFLSWC